MTTPTGLEKSTMAVPRGMSRTKSFGETFTFSSIASQIQIEPGPEPKPQPGVRSNPVTLSMKPVRTKNKDKITQNQPIRANANMGQR